MPLRVLALNLCGFWTSPLADRLRAVADFIKGNRIDVLLMQEGIRSGFVYDSIRQLAGMLGYEHFARSTFGFPVFYEYRVGVLTHFKIIRTASLACEVPQTEWIDAIPLPWRRRATAVTVDVPGLGITTLVSVHLTSSPKTQAAREEQFIRLWNWIDGLPLDDCCVIGGDFNTSGINPAFSAVFGGAMITGRSPDYICVDGARIIKGTLVFTDHVVSDHAGVMAEIDRIS